MKGNRREKRIEERTKRVGDCRKGGDLLSVQSQLLLVIAGVGVLMDFLMEKVVNSFICIGLAAGLFYQAVTYGGKGVLSFLPGAVLPLVLLCPLFYFRMLGAGDIKLFSVLGGILGYSLILRVMFCSFLIGAVLSGAFLISCGNLKERFSYFFNYLYTYYETGKLCSYKQNRHCKMKIFRLCPCLFVRT